jgi:hypothetical protein
VEYVPQGFEIEESENGDDGMAESIHEDPEDRTPSVIKISHDGRDDFSTISSSVGKKNIATEVKREGRSKESHVSYGGEGKANADTNKGDGVRAESKSADPSPVSSQGGIDCTYDDDVDSQAYEDEHKEEDQEDDDAFIERLSQMVDFADLLDNEAVFKEEIGDRENKK